MCLIVERMVSSLVTIAEMAWHENQLLDENPDTVNKIQITYMRFRVENVKLDYSTPDSIERNLIHLSRSYHM